jgi:prolyl oligopeptidase
MSPPHGPAFDYPPARRDDVVDDYHGTPVADPYRWLESTAAPDTQDWVAAQQQLTRAYLDALPGREAIKARLTACWNRSRLSLPVKAGGHYFFTGNDGLQNQDVLYVQDEFDGAPVELLNPNHLSADGTVALLNQGYSRDGTLLAYGLSHHGSDWQEIRVRRVNTAEDYAEVLRWCKFSRLAWVPDHSGFFYSGYALPGGQPAPIDQPLNRLYWHAVGTDQSHDLVIYERPDRPELHFNPLITDDGRYLVLYVWHGAIPRNRIYYRPLRSPEDFMTLLDEADASYTFLGNVGPRFYFLTDLQAPHGRIVAIDLDHPDRECWEEILPQGADSIDFARLIGGYLAVVHLRDAQHHLQLYTCEGAFVRRVALPTAISIVGMSGRDDDAEMFVGVQSFLQPTSVWRYDCVTDALEPFHQQALAFDAATYETRQVFYTSTDGTRVPMFLTHRRGLEQDGSHPTVLYGYGGFAVNLTPFFSTFTLLWLESGGVFAAANLRGGGEYGDTWHQDGMLAHKQQVFDDFIAAAEWLISEGYTRSDALAIMGRSNGGLLVATCMLQRPELFAAVLCGVPVTDMLRYHRFTVGRFWVPEYGNAEADPEHFRVLYAYSPLHNVTPGQVYPPSLITTGDSDDRVVPAHAFKFVATLQAASTRRQPILLRVDTRAGHGLGKPVAKLIEEQTDMAAFLFDTLHLLPP